MQVSLERCAIREWRLDDAPLLTRHANNRRVWLGLRDLFPHPYAIENAHEFLRQAAAEKPTTKFCIDIEGSAAGLRQQSRLGTCAGKGPLRFRRKLAKEC